ncbi:MAG TPA: toxin-antitoxin system HicB family antitoxin [Jiangellaceae bacterium]|nr:toxin-antitoxin system HicB family antitoxin [Jiangellaceae bacterium]
MELTPFVDALRHDLAKAGEAASADVRDAAERLSYALEPSARLLLLDALGSAAAEVSAQLPTAVVEVRLRGRDADLVVYDPGESMAAPPRATPVPEPDEETSRISFRLPESLKSRVEDAAAAEGLSVNAWLVRAVTQTLDGTPPGVSIRVGRHVTGWMR